MQRTVSFALYALHTHVSRKVYTYLAVVAGLLLIWALYMELLASPSEFPTRHFVVVEESVSLSNIADSLYTQRVIRSPFLFKTWMRVTGGDRTVNSGRYLFVSPLSMFEVAHKIERGDTGIRSVRVTLPEGMTVREMGEELSSKLPDFDAQEFYILAESQEGYLFPDTYFFEDGTTPGEVVSRIRENFDERTKELSLNGKELDDVVVMASIIEKEASTAEDRRIVSGILWNRMREDMPLQVDAVFGYIHGVSGYTPTASDLASDSPYNTYRVRGLPPTPIANPGLDALIAASNPPSTDYYYYLTGRDGLMHYARNFEEHKRNRELYLD